MRALLAGIEQVHVRDRDGWGHDCDTWDDLATARQHREDG
jgi:CTP:molybdopterin cytidylyltransferase MocA